MYGLTRGEADFSFRVEHMEEDQRRFLALLHAQGGTVLNQSGACAKAIGKASNVAANKPRTPGHSFDKEDILEDARATGATEKVLRRYFTIAQARHRDQGLLSMEKSRVLEGDLAEDTYNVFATALVSKQADQCVVRYKVQRTKVVGKWSCMGLGTDFREQEVLVGPDDLLDEKIGQDLRKALSVAAPPSSQ